MSDGEIAAQAHLNRGTVGRVLDGDPRVGVETLRAVARVLGFEDLAPIFEKAKAA
jgi:DNA-binding LacI/PurR family transcriptional regulator